MSFVKTKVDQSEVLNFLKKNFDEKIDVVNFITGGEMSQAFSFTSKNQELIVRFNSYKSSFIKDKYVYDNFASIEIPIPKVVEIGEFGDKFYCVSERAIGEKMDDLNEKDRERIYPKLMEILDAIHSVKLPSGKYGWWEGEGVARFDSWQGYILHKTNELLARDKKNLKITFLEDELIDKISKEIKKLITKLPEDRSLIHGDYGSNNVISDGEKITGILDWGNSIFGDFLYDAAYQEFWTGDYKLYKIYKKHYEENGWDIKNYHERFKCYLLYVGIGILEFWEKTGLELKYRKSEKRLLEYLRS